MESASGPHPQIMQNYAKRTVWPSGGAGGPIGGAGGPSGGPPGGAGGPPREKGSSLPCAPLPNLQ